MFIIDEFSFADEDNKPTERTMAAQVRILCAALLDVGLDHD